jgi:hypothetical protein
VDRRHPAGMRDRELYQRILGIESPWAVTDVALDLERREVRVEVAMQKDRLPCPKCGVDAPAYDSLPSDSRVTLDASTAVARTLV